MNIKIARNKLMPALNLVNSVVEKRQTLPILANIWFSHLNGKLNLVGTDLEVEISETIDGAEGDNCEFTLSSRKIGDITRMMPDNATISFKKDSDSVIVSAGKSRYTLKTLSADDFPRIKTESWEERFKINQLDLKNIFDKTAFSMAVQDVRYYLNGVLLEINKKRLSATATNGHRLARTEIDISLDTEDLRQIIVPRKAISEINRFIDGDNSSELTIELNKNHLKLTNGDTIIISKLIDGKFPEFSETLETKLDINLKVNRSDFISTMNRAAVLTTDRFKGVKILLEPGLMRVTANNPEQEEAVEELEIEYNGETVETGYNIGYLIEAAGAITTEYIELNFQGNDGICIMAQPEDDRSTWLIMPMRI